MKILLTLALSLLVQSSQAATQNGVTFPDNEKIGEKSLVLNGLGTRLASFLGFKVKVYVAALYVDKKSSQEDDILTNDSPKKIVMEFTRDVSKDKITKSWEEGFTKNCKEKCGVQQTHLQKFLGLMADMKEKERMTFTFYPDKLTIENKQKELNTITNADFANIILSVFIGPNPPNTELKNGLLGKAE